MKSNALKRALEQWEKHEAEKTIQGNTQIRSVVPPARECGRLPVGEGAGDTISGKEPQSQEPTYVLGPDGLHIRRRMAGKSQREIVAGGDILWEPVDRAAAMLTARAPWWAHPPSKPHKPNPNMQTINKQPKSYDDTTREHSRDKSTGELAAEVSTAVIKKTDKAVDETRELVDKAMDARAALDLMCDSWKKSWFDFMEGSNARLLELRQTRMAFDTETRQLMANLREVRAFFMDKDYESERTRLAEFVSLCERLQRLKDSGFLDKISDTILNLSAQ